MEIRIKMEEEEAIFHEEGEIEATEKGEIEEETIFQEEEKGEIEAIEEVEVLKRPKIPISERWNIVFLRRQGLSYRKIASLVGRPQSCCREIFIKWEKTGDVVDLPRSGRPCEITEEEKETLVSTARAHPDMSLNQLLEESKVSFSKVGAWRVLHEKGFKSRSQSTKWKLDNDHRETRVAWAKRYLDKPAEFWTRVIFSDESIVQRRSGHGRYWMEGKEKPPPIERDRWDAKRLIWGSISYDGKCLIEVINGSMNSDSYLDIMKRRLLKGYKNLGGTGRKRMIFQQDGARFHKTVQVFDYFEKKSIEVLPWPPKSPDLNPIEEVWAWLKRQLKHSYRSGKELENDIRRIWGTIPIEFIRNLYRSMPARIKAVIEGGGAPTDY